MDSARSKHNKGNCGRVGGAIIAADVVILAALTRMFTSAKAMAIQNYLAVKSQRGIPESEIRCEEYVMQTVPERKKEDMEETYCAKGFKGEE